MFGFLNTIVSELTWWQLGLVIIYTIYSLIRAYYIYDYGVKNAILGSSKEVRLYHVIWTIIDIPSIILGKLYPTFKYVFSIKLFSLPKSKQ